MTTFSAGSEEPAERRRSSNPLKKQNFVEKELLREFESVMKASRLAHREPKLKKTSSRPTMSTAGSQQQLQTQAPTPMSFSGPARAPSPAARKPHSASVPTIVENPDLSMEPGTLMFSNKPALWSQSDGSHTLQFEWPAVVRDPSKKNIVRIRDIILHQSLAAVRRL